MPIITLLTDFGSRDPYVAEMKGVILTICPPATIVDITHEVEKFNIRMGAFILAAAAPYFPEGTIHVAVVDPGVGGARKAIIVKTQRALYVGPDNGILIPASMNDQIIAAYEISNKSFMRPEVSWTFHGRDIFAYAAALIACGAKPEDAGEVLDKYVIPSYAAPTVSGKSILCEILHVDGFGNVITNVPAKALEGIPLSPGVKLQISGGRGPTKATFARTYSDVKKGKLVALIGSHGFLEIGMNMGNAAKALKVRPSYRLKISIT